MVKYKKVFACDLCNSEVEVEIAQGTSALKYEPPEGWKPLKDGALLMCDACARKLAAPDKAQQGAGVAISSAKDAEKIVSTATTKASAKTAAVTARN